MPALIQRRRLAVYWHDRRNRCLWCKRPIQDRKKSRWCCPECEDYWVQDSI
jgi:hypothetical protein